MIKRIKMAWFIQHFAVASGAFFPISKKNTIFANYF